MKFTRQQIGTEYALIQASTIHSSESKVFQQWKEYAEKWLSEPNDYAYEGFRSFFDRSAKEILLDFHLNGGLEDDLTEQELNDLLAEISCLD